MYFPCVFFFHLLRSDQRGVRVRVTITVQYAESLGFSYAVTRTPDSDIFFILLFHASNFDIIIYLSIRMRKNRKLINISALAKEMGKDWCEFLSFLRIHRRRLYKCLWRKRKSNSSEKTHKNSTFPCFFQVFHIFIIFYLFFLWYMISSVVTEEYNQRGAQRQPRGKFRFLHQRIAGNLYFLVQ